MPAKRRARHMYSVWVEVVEGGHTRQEMLYFDTNERQAHLIFARAIVNYPNATAAELRRSSKTLVRVEIERFD